MMKKYIAILLPVAALISWSTYILFTSLRSGKTWQVIVSLLGLLVLLGLTVVVARSLRKM